MMKFSFIGLFLIILGGLYLANNLGLLNELNINLGLIWNTYWPAILIILGFSMFGRRKPKNKDNN